MATITINIPYRVRRSVRTKAVEESTIRQGGMAERTKAPVLKTGGPGDGSRGFESHSLRL